MSSNKNGMEIVGHIIAIEYHPRWGGQPKPDEPYASVQFNGGGTYDIGFLNVERPDWQLDKPYHIKVDYVSSGDGWKRYRLVSSELMEDKT